MPKRIMPPAYGPASRITTSWPARARWYAAERPDGPAPTIRTRFLDFCFGFFELPAALERLVAEKALDRVDADRRVERGAVARGFARW